MNSLEAGAEDFGGDGAGAGDEGVVSFQARLGMFLCSLPPLGLKFNQSYDHHWPFNDPCPAQ